MDPDGFEILLERFLSGEATSEEMASLERLLRADGAKRRTLVERCLLEVHLHKAFSGIVRGRDAPRARPPGAPRRRVTAWLACAAAVLLVAGLSWYWLGRGKVVTHEVVSGNVLVDNVLTARIPEGAGFEVVGDVPAVISLSDGSRVELDPPSKGVIRGQSGGVRQVIALTQGGGRFRVAHSGGQFRVDTAPGTVTVLGTEFVARLQPPLKVGKEAGNNAPMVLAVAVAEGRVQVDTRANRYTLSAGQRRVFGDDGDQNDKDDGDQNQQGDNQ